MVNVLEIWNQPHTQLLETGALVEDHEEGTGVLSPGGSNTIIPIPESEADPDMEPVEGTSPEGADGYLMYKYQTSADEWLTDPTNLEGREEMPVIYAISYEQSGYEHHAVPHEQASAGIFPDFSDSNIIDPPIDVVANHPDLPQVTAISGNMYKDVISKIQTEYQTLQNELPDVVDKITSGLAQGAIEPEDILDAEDLMTDFDPNNKRSAMARELMAIGADVPGDPAHQVKISHPDLQAEELWVDLYLRLEDSADLSIDGPMTIPASDYKLAWIGYHDDVTGEYVTDETLAGTEDLEILEIEAPEQIVVDGSHQVGEGGTVELSRTDSEETPTPLTESDPAYDEWGITIEAGDGTTDKLTVGDAYVEEETWKVDTNLSEGLAVEQIRYNPPATYRNTSFDTYSATEFSVEEMKKIIERRREFNDAVDDAFGGWGGGGGIFDGGLPSLPGFGFIESVVIVILAIFGLNAASG